MKAQHSANTPKWGTPIDLVERARRCMGSIDIDPCSSVRFNKVVRAARYFARGGQHRAWYGNALVNPPGGLVSQFWERAVSELALGNSEQQIWIGFSVEQLCTLIGKAAKHPFDFPTVICRKRISFTRHDGYRASPTHGNYITGLGVDVATFAREFGELGRLILPVDSVAPDPIATDKEIQPFRDALAGDHGRDFS